VHKLDHHLKFINGLQKRDNAIMYINLFWNIQIDYMPEPMSDLQQKDHWQTPRETLERGTGDSEDIAIGKYFDLQQLGFKPQLAYGFAGGQAHMLCLCDGHRLDSQHEPTTIAFSFNDHTTYVNGVANHTPPSTIFPQWAHIIRAHRTPDSDRQIERLAHVTGL